MYLQCDALFPWKFSNILGPVRREVLRWSQSEYWNAFISSLDSQYWEYWESFICSRSGEWILRCKLLQGMLGLDLKSSLDVQKLIEFIVNISSAWFCTRRRLNLNLLSVWNKLINWNCLSLYTKIPTPQNWTQSTLLCLINTADM